MSKELYACICEGGAETAILNILLDKNLLKFSRDDLLYRDLIPVRSAKDFEEQYLRMGFNRPIVIYRILDSRRENYKLSKAYRDLVKVINVVTAPEIEMLVILAENKYNEYKKANLKPSQFCIQILKMRKVKKPEFIYSYFSDPNKLVSVIIKYKSISKVKPEECTLADLLR